MPGISTAHKFAIAGRIASQRAQKSRTLGALRSAVTLTARSLVRVLLTLWHEVTGFIFLVFAGIGGVAALREYRAYNAGAPHAGATQVATAIGFTIIFAWFGVTSFRRARRAHRK